MEDHYANDYRQFFTSGLASGNHTLTYTHAGTPDTFVSVAYLEAYDYQSPAPPQPSPQAALVAGLCVLGVALVLAVPLVIFLLRRWQHSRRVPVDHETVRPYTQLALRQVEPFSARPLLRHGGSPGSSTLASPAIMSAPIRNSKGWRMHLAHRLDASPVSSMPRISPARGEHIRLDSHEPLLESEQDVPRSTPARGVRFA
jgi:hypothetical protein